MSTWAGADPSLASGKHRGSSHSWCNPKLRGPPRYQLVQRLLLQVGGTAQCYSDPKGLQWVLGLYIPPYLPRYIFFRTPVTNQLAAHVLISAHEAGASALLSVLLSRQRTFHAYGRTCSDQRLGLRAADGHPYKM